MEECRKWNYALDLTRGADRPVTERSLKQSCNTISEINKPTKRKPEELDDDDDELEKKRILANSQERARMHKINKALDDLRKCLPQQFNLYHRRMSKIRTLRLAMNYINDLAELIRNDDIRRKSEYSDAFSRAPAPVHTATTSMLELPATVMPYYPYLREACSGYSAIESMYRTPDQPHHPPAVYNPRHLDFGAVTQADSTPSHPETIIAGSVCTPVKPRSTKRLFKGEGIMTPEPVCGSLRSETFSSPFLGIRYQAELNTSLPSTSFESLPEGTLEPGQIPTRGTCRTLADIIDEDD